MQVFFESKQVIEEAALKDAAQHVSSLFNNPTVLPLIKARLHPQSQRYHRNRATLRRMWDCTQLLRLQIQKFHSRSLALV